MTFWKGYRWHTEVGGKKRVTLNHLVAWIFRTCMRSYITLMQQKKHSGSRRRVIGEGSNMYLETVGCEIFWYFLAGTREGQTNEVQKPVHKGSDQNNLLLLFMNFEKVYMEVRLPSTTPFCLFNLWGFIVKVVNHCYIGKPAKQLTYIPGVPERFTTSQKLADIRSKSSCEDEFPDDHLTTW